MDPFLGQMLAVGFNFAPVGWLQASGQILSISSYAALFSLLGTSFGGNGTSTFALPNMQGALAISSGQGPGLSDYSLGESGGVPAVTLSLGEMASHNHVASLFEPRSGTGDATQPGGNILAPPATNVYITGNTSNLTTNLAPTALSMAGGNPAAQPHNNMMPFLVLNWIICMNGIFPTRG